MTTAKKAFAAAQTIKPYQTFYVLQSSGRVIKLEGTSKRSIKSGCSDSDKVFTATEAKKAGRTLTCS